MFVCLSPGGQSLTQGETPKRSCSSAPSTEFFRSRNAAALGEVEGTLVPGKHFSSIIFEPTTQTLFGGTYSGEIYASADLGKTWERRDSGIGDKEIYSLATPGRRWQAAGVRGHPAGASILQRRSRQELDRAAGLASSAGRGEVDLSRSAAPRAREEHHVSSERSEYYPRRRRSRRLSQEHRRRQDLDDSSTISIPTRIACSFRPTIRASSTARRRRPIAVRKRRRVFALAATAARAGRA